VEYGVQVISAVGLSKRYGSTLAVDSLSFEVQPGHVTGFLGPNGSGKSTTMRLLLGLDRPSAGSSTFNGTPYHELTHPLREVGALLDAAYVHPSRKARQHLRALAAANGIGRKRVDEVLGLVGLTEVADRKLKTYSLGMKQRLGIAAALLGDPHTLILDEPANGLDPEGMRWIRDFLSYLAGQGKTIFVSSHLLSETALMADHLVVIGRGRLIEEGSVAGIVDRYADKFVRVRSPQADELVALATGRTASAVKMPDGAVQLRGMPVEAVGELAAEHRIVLHELANESGSLEDAFLALTGGVLQYRSAPLPPSAAPPPPVAPGTIRAVAGSPAPPAPSSPAAAGQRLHIPGQADGSPPCFGLPDVAPPNGASSVFPPPAAPPSSSPSPAPDADGASQ
jgi:ABC-2 type transport system ATP-binding protein